MLKVAVLVYLMLPYFLGFGQIKYYETGDTLTVLAKSGLALRDSFAINSNKILFVPFGGKVVVHGLEYHGDYVDERHGSWIEVKTGGNVGYMFSGYLTQLKIPAGLGQKTNCYKFEQFEEIANLNVDTLISEGERRFDSFWDNSIQRIHWKNFNDGTTLTWLTGNEFENLIIESYDYTMNDIRNLLEYYITLLDNCSNMEWSEIPLINIIKDDYGLKKIEFTRFQFSGERYGGKIRVVSSLY